MSVFNVFRGLGRGQCDVHGEGERESGRWKPPEQQLQGLAGAVGLGLRFLQHHFMEAGCACRRVHPFQVYDATLCKHTTSHTHGPTCISERVHRPAGSLVRLDPRLRFPRPRRRPLSASRRLCLFWIFHLSGVLQHGALSAWPHAPSTTFWRFFCVVIAIQSSFLSSAMRYSNLACVSSSDGTAPTGLLPGRCIVTVPELCHGGSMGPGVGVAEGSSASAPCAVLPLDSSFHYLSLCFLILKNDLVFIVVKYV